MFKDMPKHYRTSLFGCLWSLAMVLVVLLLSFTDQVALTYVAFAFGTAGSIFWLVLAVLQFRSSKRDPGVD